MLDFFSFKNTALSYIILLVLSRTNIFIFNSKIFTAICVCFEYLCAYLCLCSFMIKTYTSSSPNLSSNITTASIFYAFAFILVFFYPIVKQAGEYQVLRFLNMDSSTHVDTSLYGIYFVKVVLLYAFVVKFVKGEINFQLVELCITFILSDFYYSAYTGDSYNATINSSAMYYLSVAAFIYLIWSYAKRSLGEERNYLPFEGYYFIGLGIALCGVTRGFDRYNSVSDDLVKFMRILGAVVKAINLGLLAKCCLDSVIRLFKKERIVV